MSDGGAVRVWAPGRVNLIGEHTDYMGGLVLPMAVDLGITIEGRRGGDRITLTSDAEAQPVDIPLPIGDPALVQPAWGRFVAAMAAELGATEGLVGTIASTLPKGSGLSSSTALTVAAALALGDGGPPVETAQRCLRAEIAATGVPGGLMDQLVISGGVAGHALLIDCRSLTFEPVPIPLDAQVVVLHSGQHRQLAGSAYADRRAQCEAAESIVGPLRDATLSDLDAITDPLLRRRARHVVSENGRVVAFAAALRDDDLVAAGALMLEGHRSLRDDFEVSTDALDGLVQTLATTPGVHGARLTGAGFGGCVVALTEPGLELEGPAGVWIVQAVDGARNLAAGGPTSG